MNFWHQFEAHSCIDGCQCEWVRDALIRQPSSAWSSFFILLTVFFLVRSKISRTHEFQNWLWVLTLMSVSSFLAHAGFLRFTLAMDFAAISLVIFYFSLNRFIQHFTKKRIKIVLGLISFYIIAVILMYFLSKWYKTGFIVILFLVSIIEMTKTIQRPLFFSLNFLLSVFIFLASLGFFIADEAHWLCDSKSWWQFHSLWHFGIAVSLYFYSKWHFVSKRD